MSTNGNSFPFLQESIDRILGSLDPTVARALDNALNDKEVSIEEGVRLFDATGPELLALTSVADELRRRTVGNVVTYVVNRNINFTNVCIKRCGFCAFSRDHRMEEGYLLPTEEILRRAQEAWDLGATEICVQAGLPPKMKGDLYINLSRAIKKQLPNLHIHGFSPEEILYGAVRSRCSIGSYLADLREAGVGSLPGTSAEILDDDIRDRISPGRISTQQWIEVVTTAHKVGIPTTCTIMYGHIENSWHKARHIALLRDIQKATGGFTEFVPLSLIHDEAPMFQKGLIPDIRPGATGIEVVKMHAVSRIMLHGHIKNIQASWVKEGPKMTQLLLAAGANDLGGTLINESISTSAGAGYGQLVAPRELRRIVWDAGRVPAERETLYSIRRIFETPEDNPIEALDKITAEEAQQRFGSYHELIRLDQFRYREKPEPATTAKGSDRRLN